MSHLALIGTYLAVIVRTRAGGHARELSYRPALANFLGHLLPAANFTHEGERIAGVGAPDFIARATLHGACRIIGCIETKNIGEQDLHGKSANQAQFNRYKTNFPNCVFTDYLRFVFYQNGELVDDIAIAELNAQGDITALPQNHARFIALLESAFIGQEFRIDSADQLVASMANLAREMANGLALAMQKPDTDAGVTLLGHMQGFNEYLLDDITPTQFADIVAQTTTYGLLIARVKCPPDTPFTRQQAAALIPPNIHLLRVFFQTVTGVQMAREIEWIVDRLVDIFAVADVRAIMRRHGQQTGVQDPVFHFYESFLSKYNPQERFKRGVWYTPQPVVNFIVRAAHEVLQNQLGIKNGLANTDQVTVPVARKSKGGDGNGAAETETEMETFHKVQILDPGTGTGAFPAEVIRQIHANVDQGEWSDYVEQHLLPRVNGFEILMAPYAMSHLRLDLLLRSLGYAPRQDPPPRIKVFLSNALHLQDADRAAPLMAEWISAEARAAERVKTHAPVICVLGNPPYLAASANNGEWINQMMDDYKTEPGGGQRLQEKNPKWINDDYVKFIRYGQHFIEKGGRGIVAFVNPHGFLDNRTFRGMRWRLLRAYDRIYVIDMHGNSRKKERAPDGGRDDNVFNIQQGVSINLFVKTGEKPAGALARVFHCDLFGERQHKYDFLRDHSLADVPFAELQPQAPMYYMVPRDHASEAEYNQGILITDLFPLHGVGMTSKRDKVAYQHSKQEMRAVVEQIHLLTPEQIRQRFPDSQWDSRDGKAEFCKQDIANTGIHDNLFVKCLCRPFDHRWTYYTGVSKGFIGWPVPSIMRHFTEGQNLGLLFCKDYDSDAPPVMATYSIINSRCWTRSGTTGVEYCAPLYLYSASNGQAELGAPAADRAPNLNMTLVWQIATHLGLKFSHKAGKNTLTPENLFDYIYAALHSPAYRAKYAQFLKTDFPRIPMPASTAQFRRLAKIGEKLRQTHLLQHPAVHKSRVAFPVDGDHFVSAIQHKNDCVYINRAQHFTRVPAAAWNAQIGGYQPAQQFLKDRKNRALSLDDIKRYKQIIAALLHTQTLVNTIDD